MESIKTVIIGGGASALFLATRLDGNSVCVLERADRVGKKLSATGNGQGNVTNENADGKHYFSIGGGSRVITDIIEKYGNAEIKRVFSSLGGALTSDARGRVYPVSRQASSVTDMLRWSIASQKKRIELNAFVCEIKPVASGFVVTYDKLGEKTSVFAENVVLATGGMAAKNFGTDGNGYLLARSLSHSVTKTYPSLVQIKTNTEPIRGLKGIRVQAKVSAVTGGDVLREESGDVIFTDYGVSGDAIFRISAFITHLECPVRLEIDLLPALGRDELADILSRRLFGGVYPQNEILSGIVANQLGRVIIREAGSTDVNAVVNAIKSFTLDVKGTLGYDYAQVTKGGVSLDEVSAELESKKHKGLYFAGEILDVDGECGGYNLQWAFSSACAVADAINDKVRTVKK